MTFELFPNPRWRSYFTLLNNTHLKSFQGTTTLYNKKAYFASTITRDSTIPCDSGEYSIIQPWLDNGIKQATYLVAWRSCLIRVSNTAFRIK
ncbi:MAG: hypothetical protein G01um10143_78 [Parcubacteria group bacterium Gr01-1014_3]|nr:MAG: hypothetical protein G01um10143_78 [Parcubacteria group bacterium Gr01-1014_3]